MRKRQLLWDPTSVPTFWINHASRLLMRRFDEQLRPLGLSMAYLHVVVTLQEHGPLQQKDLLPFIHVEQPTMAALLKRMERDSLVSRKPNPNDSRAQFVVLTSRARSALVNAKDMMAKVVEDALAGVSEADRQRLTGTLQLIIRNLSDAPSH
jgi:DNA-binding MarR family transcriptional regulator